MKPGLSEQLSANRDNLTQNLSQSPYGDFPQSFNIFPTLCKNPNDGKVLLKKLDKLSMILKSILVLENFIKSQRGEKLKDWLANNDAHVSNIVYKELGDFTNKNEGITGQLLKIQDMYNNEEEDYDKNEAKYLGSASPELRKLFENLSNDRAAKRKNRRESIKAKRNDLKKKGKGDLVMDNKTESTPADANTSEAPTAKNVVDNPEKLNEGRETPADFSADATKSDTEKLKETASALKQSGIVNSNHKPAKINKKVLLWGTTITLGILAVGIYAFSGNKKGE